MPLRVPACPQSAVNQATGGGNATDGIGSNQFACLAELAIGDGSQVCARPCVDLRVLPLYSTNQELPFPQSVSGLALDLPCWLDVGNMSGTTFGWTLLRRESVRRWSLFSSPAGERFLRR